MSEPATESLNGIKLLNAAHAIGLPFMRLKKMLLKMPELECWWYVGKNNTLMVTDEGQRRLREAVGISLPTGMPEVRVNDCDKLATVDRSEVPLDIPECAPLFQKQTLPTPALAQNIPSALQNPPVYTPPAPVAPVVTTPPPTPAQNAEFDGLTVVITKPWHQNKTVMLGFMGEREVKVKCKDSLRFVAGMRVPVQPLHPEMGIYVVTRYPRKRGIW